MQNIADPSEGPDKARGPLQLHGGLVRVNGTGVLLLGESGSGKSDCALRLLAEGHQMVADDVVEIMRLGDRIVGNAPAVVRHLLAIRGRGILNVREIFGESSVAHQSQIDLCVEISDRGEVMRAADDDAIELLECRIPRLIFTCGPGNDLAAFIKTAVGHPVTPPIKCGTFSEPPVI